MNTVTEILKDKWRDIEELSTLNYSFMILIQFEEFGMNGEENKHIGTGAYYHLKNQISICDKELRKMHPKKFFPLYENVQPYEDGQ